MNDQSRRFYAIPPAVFQHLIKSFHAASPEPAGLLSSRESKRPAAVDPGLIHRIPAQILIILSLKASEITFPEFFDLYQSPPRIQDLRCLDAPPHRTCINPLNLRRLLSFQSKDSFLTQVFLCSSDIPVFPVPRRTAVPDEIHPYHPLITVPTPQITR